MMSSSVRPNSFNTCIPRDLKNKSMAEKMQITATPSAKAPVVLKRKIKTPGRWDSVMVKIEKSKTFSDTKSHNNNNSKTGTKAKILSNYNRSVVTNGSIHKISPSDELSVANDNNNSSHLRPSSKSASIPTMTKTNTLHSITSKVNIPKSKTFVRDTNGNNSTGSQRCQQPVPASEPSLPTTPMTGQPPLPIAERNSSQMINRDKGVVASINDRKTSNRRPIHSNTTTGSSLPSKRLNGKIIGTNANPSKKDSRSSQSAEDKQQIQKLTQLCETKTKQLKNLDINQNYMRLAFDSLAVVIQHLIEQFEPFENPKLKNALQIANERCEQLKDDLNAKDVELNDMRLIFEEQINQLMKEREKNYSDLNQAKLSHESNIKKLKEIHSMEVKKICENYEKQLFLSQQNCNQLKNEIQLISIELVETKQLRDALELKTKQMEDNIMNDKDKKFKYLSEKSKQLELEVDSLKAVMDMKNEKIHSLERKMIETQEKINELPTAKESVRSLQQQVETLQITLDRKIHQFNQLTRQHEDLKLEFDKEMREKRRLSMKNEELAFHLSESLHESTPGLNNCTNFFDGHPFKTPVPVRVLHNDETPIKVNRSISINNGPTPTERAFTRKSHSKVNRSVSASSGTSNSTLKNSSFIYCPLSSGSEVENNFIANNEMSDNEVFDSGTGFSEHSHQRHEPNRKSFKVKLIERLSDETTPQSIFDSGFEEIQGLNSLPK